jgi:hypothetical protein
MSGAYHALVADGLWKDVLSFSIVTAGAAIVAKVKLIPAWRKHREQQDRTADLLDTQTPGGLADVVDALKGLESKEKQ